MMSHARADFAKSLALLAVSLGFELDEPTIGVYWHALRAVPPEIRREAFAAAVDHKWYRLPQPGELKRIAAEVLERKRAAAAALHLAECGHSGRWLEDQHGNILGRCPCWHRAQDAMAQVGQRIALPATSEVDDGR